jgi:hypothetical protein
MYNPLNCISLVLAQSVPKHLGKVLMLYTKAAVRKVFSQEIRGYISVMAALKFTYFLN